MNLSKSSPGPSRIDEKIESSQSNKINGWLTKNYRKESLSSRVKGNRKASREISDISNVKSKVLSNKCVVETDPKETEKYVNRKLPRTKSSKHGRKEDMKKLKNLTALGELDIRNANGKNKQESVVTLARNSNDCKENFNHDLTPSRNGSTSKRLKSVYDDNLKPIISPNEETRNKEDAPKKLPKSASTPVSKKLYEIDMWQGQGSSITSWLTKEGKQKNKPLPDTRSAVHKNVDIKKYKESISGPTGENNKEKVISNIIKEKNTTTDTKQFKHNLNFADTKNRGKVEMESDSKSKPKKTKKKEDDFKRSPSKQRNIGKCKNTQTNKVSGWLSKDTPKGKLENKTEKKYDEINELDISDKSHTLLRNNRVLSRKHKKIVKTDAGASETHTKNPSSKKRTRSQSSSADDGKPPAWQQRLDSFLTAHVKETVGKQKPKRQNSQNSEFPSIENVKKLKTNKNTECFKKYGIRIPSVDEILKEQKDFQKYKTQIESFQPMEDFDLPFSVKDLNTKQVISNEHVLGCSNLSLDELNEAFKRNLTYASDILHGTKYSERHERFFSNNNNKCYNLGIKDLTYSTSMIVFSYEQKEQLIKFLKENFDPEDKKTSYFFQVLLPELCLKIFMDTHQLTYDEAVNYLETRPIVDD